MKLFPTTRLARVRQAVDSVVLVDPLEPRRLLAGWQAFHPGSGGQMQDLELDPNNPGVAYSLSDVSGLTKTTNYGDTWVSLPAVNTNSLLGMEVDPHDSDHLILGTMRGVIESFDGGVSWDDLAGTTQEFGRESTTLRTGLPVATIEFDDTNSGRAYFANSWLIKNSLNVWNEFDFKNDKIVNGVRDESSDIRHPGVIYRRDPALGGDKWQQVTFEPNTANEYMNVYSIVSNPDRPQQVFVAAHTGIYRSDNYGQSWQKLPGPTDLGQIDRYASGIEVSPDGQRLYATYKLQNGFYGDLVNRDADSKPDGPSVAFYVAENITNGNNAGNTTWTKASKDLSIGLSTDGGAYSALYWNPIVDPDTTDGVDKVLLGSLGGSPGLWQADFDTGVPVNTTLADNSEWNRILFSSNRSGINGVDDLSFQYDMGWDKVNIGSRIYTFTPDNWQQANANKAGDLWVQAGQRIFVGDTTPGDETASRPWPYTPDSWVPRYTQRYDDPNDPNDAGGFETYGTTGIQSTVNFESAGYQNYIVQVKADNGLIESFDSGQSWTSQHRPALVGNVGTNGKAVQIFSNTGATPIVLAASGGGFGSNAYNFRLHAMELNTLTYADTWIDGVSTGRGLNERNVIRDITPAADGLGFYIISEASNANTNNNLPYAPGGIFYFADVRQLLNPNSSMQFQRLPMAAGEFDRQGSRIEIDPNDPNRLFVYGKDNEGGNQTGGPGNLYVYERSNGVWSSTNIDSQLDDITAWADGSQTYVAYSKASTSGGSVTSASLFLSADAGDNFTEIVTLDATNTNPAFELVLGYDFGRTITGLVGYNDSLFYGTDLAAHRKGLTMNRADISGTAGSPTVNVVDVTTVDGDTHPDPRMRRAGVIDVNGVPYIATDTSGSGLWVAPVAALLGNGGGGGGGNGQQPFGGTPRSISNGSVIEAEDFDQGGQDVAWNDTSVGNGPGGYRSGVDVDVVSRSKASNGFVIGQTKPGEWTEYTVDSDGGAFDISLSYAAKEATTSDVLLEFNGNVVGTFSNLPSTGGWNNFNIANLTATLPAGSGVLRMTSLGDQVHLDSLSFLGGTVRNVPAPDHRWRFDGDLDDSEGSADGSAVGTLSYSGVAATGSQSLVLDGGSEFVAVDDSDLEDSFTSYTLAVWYRLDALNNTQILYEEGGGDDGIDLRISSGVLRATVSAGGARFGRTAPTGLGTSLNTWHLAVVTYDGSDAGRLTLYVDGSTSYAQRATNLASIPAHSDPAGIGGRNGLGLYNGTSSGDGLDGRIDDVQVWNNRVLTATEIQAIYDELGTAAATATGNGGFNLVRQFATPDATRSLFSDDFIDEEQVLSLV